MSAQHTEPQSRAAQEATAALVHALDNAEAFGHPLHDLRIVETHISWIILTGEYAYKIKKPVDFGFLDFSTLEKRRHFCDEELRLNRRFAPAIYLEVVEISGTPSAPRLHGGGEAIEYAVKMVEFSQQSLLSSHAEAGTLTPAMVDAIANRVDALHADVDRAAPDSGFGSADSVQHWSAENLTHLRDTVPAELMPASFAELEKWYRGLDGIRAQIEQRRRDGYVRECHGDLHLGNMALIEGEITPFDCIEFNPELRWIDTISEAAFVAMDLQARGYPGYGWRFINRYLEHCADYAALELLRYYIVYRALVRAKVEALRVEPGQRQTSGAFSEAFSYLELAARWSRGRAPGLILMHGLSGSGKSTVAAQLVESLGAIQLRSDIVRKRLFDLAANADSGSATDAGIYSADATEATYRELRDIAGQVTDAGFRVIVDATFLLRSQREVLLELARERGLPCVVVDCAAPVDELRRRIVARENDPSEANLEVLERQLQRHEPVEADEAGITAVVRLGADGLSDPDAARIEQSLTGNSSVNRQ